MEEQKMCIGKDEGCKECSLEDDCPLDTIDTITLSQQPVAYIDLSQTDNLEIDILKEVLRYEVKPAMGCTEPIAVALAASIANKRIGGSVEEIIVIVSSPVLKNGRAVTVPNTNGAKGLAIAAALGCVCDKPELQLEVLSQVDDESLKKAKAIVDDGKVTVCHLESDMFYLEVHVLTDNGSATVSIMGSHTNTKITEVNGKIVKTEIANLNNTDPLVYTKILPLRSIDDLIGLANGIDSDDYRYLQEGIIMNLAVSKVGLSRDGVGSNLKKLVALGVMAESIVTSSQIITSAAVDARMGGINMPVMSSGGSGNQGIVAILVPYEVGTELGVSEDKIIRSIAFSHLLNSYVKCHIGTLSPICGCAVAAGVGAAGAIALQQSEDKAIVNNAINNVLADIAGLLCDGAKGGCALKVVTATSSAIRAAFLAVNGFSIFHEGLVEERAEDSIANLGRISKAMASAVDNVLLGI